MHLKHLLIVVTILFTLGCSDPDASTGDDPSIKIDGAPPATIETHSHGSEGPHRGTLIELGNEEYHAELVHDDKSVTVYILDRTARKPVPIAAPEVLINVVASGKPAQFKLPAEPDSGDAPGKSSRFSLSDTGLAAQIDDASSAPKLSVSIDGTSYRGEIKHQHDEAHVHGADDHHAHDHAHDHAH